MRWTAFLFLLFIAGSALAQSSNPAGPAAEVINQARVGRTITPSDTVDLALGPTRYLFDGMVTACTIAVILMDDGVAITFSLPANIANPFLPLRVKRVLATGTTCTPIIGLW